MKIKNFVTTTEFLVGTFVSFVLTTILFTVILVEGFVSKDFLKQNNIYLNGKFYKLCRIK